MHQPVCFCRSAILVGVVLLVSCLDRPADFDHVASKASTSVSERIVGFSWPPNGFQSSPIELESVLLGFTSPLGVIPRIVSDAGDVPLQVAGWEDCRQWSLDLAQCLEIQFLESLDSSTAYHLVLVDNSLDAFALDSFWFKTRREQSTSIQQEWSRLTCAFDEILSDLGCLLVKDDMFSIQLASNTPTQVWFEIEDKQMLSFVSSHPKRIVWPDLLQDHSYLLKWHTKDLFGQLNKGEFLIQTREDMADIILTEVLANPIDHERTHEYIEVYNGSDYAVSLNGFYVSDSASRLGDEIQARAPLDPGAYALIVSEHFEVYSQHLYIPEGIPIYTTGQTLVSAGISNAGEALYLRDVQGQRVDSIPAVASDEEGMCLIRQSTFQLSQGECTPGY